MNALKCPRCDDEMEFILSHAFENGLTEYEYLCTQCFVYVKEVYDIMQLLYVISGEIGT